MTFKPNDSHMFFAYHIRSSFLACEAALHEDLVDWGLSAHHFYVLRCDWKPEGNSIVEISAHAIKTNDQSVDLLNDLIAKKYVVKNPKDDLYALTPQGVIVRTEVLQKYREHFSKATKGLSEETIETVLSALLTVQNNIPPS